MANMKPLASALALAIYGTGAFAQTGGLEEVIVTATKRSESLQDIPVTVNAFSSETIQEAGINNAGDLAIMTPTLNINVNTVLIGNVLVDNVIGDMLITCQIQWWFIDPNHQ